jgi:histidine phosphotransferase ChpT
MEKKNIDAAILELMASRICHDLISPVGAVNNGVEFLQEDLGSGDAADAIGLIAMSAQSAGARLQAFRLAYGAGGRDGGIKPADVYKTFENLAATDGKITQDWNADEVFAGMSPPEGFCKLLMGTLMMTQEALPKGGVIRVAHDPSGATTTVTGISPDALIRPQVDEALKSVLAISDIDPRLVHPYIVGVLASQYNHAIAIGFPVPGQVSFEIKPC